MHYYRVAIHGFLHAGYDYVPLSVYGFCFVTGEIKSKGTKSLNDGALITDHASFLAYPWPDPMQSDFSILEEIRHDLPTGMKCVLSLPTHGLLETVITLVGYEDLCLLVRDDPDFVQAIVDEVGERMLRYFTIGASYASVGAVLSWDDWGFKTQTMIAPSDLRRFIFPWHQRFVEAIHQTGKPAILHSCGCMRDVMEDIIAMGYDGWHSFEDVILPVEDAYEQWHDRMAILGGMDLDFLYRSSPEDVTKRASAMLARTAERGGYALGTGNSVPEYITDEKYFAMTRAAHQGILTG
jgi:uroporphyrinogen decarboxylase